MLDRDRHAIGRLRGRGAGRIVVAGMSQGGDAALAYGARRANLAGFIALAPAAAPERQVGVGDIAQNVAQARALVAAGRGDETAGFVDRNASGPFSVSWKYMKTSPIETEILIGYGHGHAGGLVRPHRRENEYSMISRWPAGTLD